MTTTPPEPDQPFGVGQPAYPGEQPQAPYGAGSYPTHPGAQPPQGGAAPEQPSSISTAVKLMLVGAALSVLSLVYSLATMGDLKDQIRDELAKNDPDVSQSTVDAAYSVGIGFAVVFGLLGAFLWVWMAWKNGQGRSWARVVATVFGGLNLVGALFTFSAGNSEPLSLVATGVSLVLAVVVLVLLWRPESTRYYEDVTRSRQLR
ncbi:hypothetical protein [Aeromicrobium stalagmiti]|uniref:hypothetical protein n=1 Tax=Aeromicrobium stalagmiti TaxID=2738988 RepID=UPI0015694037|nr:hypothetical protein [Aeromicrobium stalagmiti]NRQ48912.1 hypothetical protein [Aeromicrobium stalagmiti]